MYVLLMSFVEAKIKTIERKNRMRSGKSDMAHGSNLTKVVEDFFFFSSTKRNKKKIVNSLALIKWRWAMDME